MVDLHCHVLPGIDDGPETIERAVQLVLAAVAEGTRTIVATPHVSALYPNGPIEIASRIEELNERLTDEAVDVEIESGAEIAATHVAEMDPRSLTPLRLGRGRWLLIEPPFSLVATGLEGTVLGLMEAGHEIVLAHPERCPALHRDPMVLRRLNQAGALCSITAGSLTGRFGSTVRRFAETLMREGMAHNVASDAHDLESRPPALASELRRAGIPELAEWLTDGVPSAILAGAEIPPRPTPRRPLHRRSGMLQRLRRQ